MRRLLFLCAFMALANCQTVDIEKAGFDSRFPPTQWTKSGYGSGVRYQCKALSCGSGTTVLSFQKITVSPGSFSDLVGNANTLEDGMRKSSGARGGLRKQLLEFIGKRGDNTDAIEMNYFGGDGYVGYKLSGFSKVDNINFNGEIRFSRNTIYIFGVEAKTATQASSIYNEFRQLIQVQ